MPIMPIGPLPGTSGYSHENTKSPPQPKILRGQKVLGRALVSTETIAAAFTEWERRYRENPETFQSEAAKLLKETPKTYGEWCAPYFCQLLKELSTK